MTESDDHTARAETPKQEAFAWLIRLTSGDATTEDVRAMERWRRQSLLNEAALIRASRLWQSVGPAAARRGAGASGFGLFPHLNSAIGRRAVLGGAIAAAAAYVVVRPPFGLWPSFSELTSDFRTGTGERRKLAMAGGASVEMNTETSIDVRPASGGGDRIELISGEMAVETGIHASRPFVVIAASGRAIATDATFNMRYIASSVCITCLTGSVEVEHQGRTVSVAARQQVSYSDDRIGEATDIDPTAVAAWRRGVLIFHNEPLGQVIEEVNRYRPGRIIVTDANLNRRLVSARFRLDRLQEVITQVQQVFGANVTNLPGGIILLSS